jgi:hypothetical protein
MSPLHIGIVVGFSSIFILCCGTVGVYRSCQSRNHSYLKESKSDTDLTALDGTLA